MTRAEAEEFLGPSIDQATASTLYDESGGNPFYLEQLARSLGRRTMGHRAIPRIAADLGVPPLVASALADELASSATPHTSCFKAQPSWATPSSRSWQPPPPESSSP